MGKPRPIPTFPRHFHVDSHSILRSRGRRNEFAARVGRVGDHTISSSKVRPVAPATTEIAPTKATAKVLSDNGAWPEALKASLRQPCSGPNPGLEVLRPSGRCGNLAGAFTPDRTVVLASEMVDLLSVARVLHVEEKHGWGRAVYCRTGAGNHSGRTMDDAIPDKQVVTFRDQAEEAGRQASGQGRRPRRP